MKKIFLITTSIICTSLTSCNSNETKVLSKKVDSLQIVNANLKKELEGYKYSPAKILADIKNNYASKQYAKIKQNLALLQRYHPECSEYEIARSINEKALKDQEIARKDAQAKAAKAEAERKAKMAPVERIMEKYDCDESIAELILHHQVCRGMTAEQCRASWGRPEDINRTEGSYGVHEQWVYGDGNYLYFEDGYLTTIQN